MKKIILKNKKMFVSIALITGILASFIMPLQNCYAQSKIAANDNASQNEIAEPIRECGNSSIDTTALRVAMDYEASHPYNLLPLSFSVRVYFHILRYDNGTNPATTAGAIQNEFNTLVADYAADNICFIYCGLDYINNTNLDTNYNADNGPSSLFNQYRVPNCINIFYSKKIKGSNSACGGGCGYGGYAFSIPSTFCLVAQGNIGGQTTSHEVGHCLGLLHTFEPNYGYEYINGYQSNIRADKITDTHADPYVYKTWGCFSITSGLYSGNCLDPNVQSNFTPPYDNIMSYWSNGGATQIFTTGQFSRVNSFLNSDADLIGCESSPALIVNASTISSGYFIASSIAPLTTNGTINISGTAQVMLIAETVIISPGFHAFPAATGLLLIRPTSCGLFIPRNASVTNSEITSDENTNSIKCYPNPFSNNLTVEFGLIKDDNASIILYDLMGKKVKTISQSSYTKGKHDLSFDASDIQAGIYFVVVQCSDYKTEQKIIKVN